MADDPKGSIKNAEGDSSPVQKPPLSEQTTTEREKTFDANPEPLQTSGVIRVFNDPSLVCRNLAFERHRLELKFALRYPGTVLTTMKIPKTGQTCSNGALQS